MGPTGGSGRRGMVADINVTPLVDVMLVLLIIFMVTAPMMTEGIEVNLPATTTKALRQQEQPLVVSIDKDGKISLDKIQVDLSFLRQQLQKLPDEKKKEPIYLRADQDVPYGLVVKTMAAVKQAGFEKLGMVTRPDDTKKKE
ncbi:MAG: protein TolR [Desulfobulbus sp.]|nr:MAG: protein TolR [Desulfobulbus sp.]RUM39554.1 MAG: protein TolR [Desulfobulbus sp.]